MYAITEEKIIFLTHRTHKMYEQGNGTQTAISRCLHINFGQATQRQWSQRENASDKDENKMR